MNRAPACKRNPHGTRHGLSLAETVISIAIVGIMLVAALNTVGASQMTQKSMSDRSRAVLLAQDMMSEILRQAYQDPDSEPGSFGLDSGEVGDGSRSLWEDVDDYDGWSATPPERKDGTVIPGLEGWGRSVQVAWANPANLSQKAGSDTRVKRITVAVSRDGVVVASMVAIRTGAADLAGTAAVGG